jgi:7-cyano-7-deazaguanine synthase
MMRDEKGLPFGRQAVVLLSGGLDSATTLYLAKGKGCKCFCLIFDYGQRHKKEIQSANRIAQSASCKRQVVKISLPWKGSSLLDKKLKIPESYNPRTQEPENSRTRKLKNPIPSTYVPARNLIFLSFALSYAEVMGAGAIYIGANAVDYSGYPDCRPEFYQAFIRAAALGTKAGVEGNAVKIVTPLIRKTKAQIIKSGMSLGVPYELTWSCYKGGRSPCGECDSCRFREKGFREAGCADPLLIKR